VCSNLLTATNKNQLLVSGTCHGSCPSLFELGPQVNGCKRLFTTS
jgi:hypothetical protein